MRKNITRRGKLENKIEVELERHFPDIDKILEAVYEFEKNNISTIDKLKKKKRVDSKRINGALKQTIQAHGPITKLLIGSASKRIYGALLTNELDDDKKWSVKSIIIGLIGGVLLTTIFYFIL